MIYANKVSIEHYKGLRNIMVSGLTPVTLITGPNGSGKTAFTEAIEILLNPFDFQHYVTVTGNSPVGFRNSFDKAQLRHYTKIAGEIFKKPYSTEIVSYEPVSGGSFHGFHYINYPNDEQIVTQTKEIQYSFV